MRIDCKLWTTFFCITYGWPALAQTSTPADSAGKVSGGLEEIVVTAQKRSEPLQKVPISVTAFTAESAIAQGVQSTSDLAVAVPGMVFNHFLFSASPSIRGISDQNGGPGAEPPVSTYVDGVYMMTPQAALFPFNNIDRIEVLKGPQSTLFGRNAVGGVVNVITRTPSQKPSLDASFGYGNFNTVEGKLYATTGITDNWASDIAVYWNDQMNGWGHDLTTGAQVYKENEVAVRSKSLLTIGERTTITISMDYSDQHTNQGISYAILPGATGLNGVTYTAASPGFYNTLQNPLAYGVYKAWGTSGRIDQDLGWASMSDIVAYRGNDMHVIFDNDAVAQPFVSPSFNLPSNQITEEFQLLSPDSSKIRWVGGLFYLHGKASYAPLILQGIFINPKTSFQDTQTTRSISPFAQGTLPLPLNTNFTAGVRWTDDTKRLWGGVYNGVTGAPLTRFFDKSQSFPKWTYHFSLDHSFTDNELGYVSYTRGFKSGGFNPGQVSAPAFKPEIVDAIEMGLKSQWFDHHLRVNASAWYQKVTDLQAEIILATQGGVNEILNAAREKAYGFDLDLDIVPLDGLTLTAGVAYTDAYYSSWPAAPLYTPNPTPLCPPPHQGGNCTTAFNASGKKATETPPWGANFSAAYDIPSAIGDFRLTGSYAYVGPEFWEPDNRIQQPGYNMVNSSLMWTSTSHRWDIRLWGKNLLDKKIYNFEVEQTSGDEGSADAPRTYGISFGVHLE